MRRALVKITKEQKMSKPQGKWFNVLAGCPPGTVLVQEHEDVHTQVYYFVVENVCFEDFIHPSDYPILDVVFEECLEDRKEDMPKYIKINTMSSGTTYWTDVLGNIVLTSDSEPIALAEHPKRGIVGSSGF